MKIILYSRPYWPSVGGVEATSRILAQTLVELGHSVSVFTSTQISGHKELDEGYKICRSSGLLAFVRAARTAELVLMKGGVSAFAGLGATLAGVPKVVIWHEMSGSYEHPGKTCTARAGNLVRRRVAQRACAHVGVTNTCLESKCLSGGTKRSIRRVIYNPIPKELATAAAARDQPCRATDVLFVGRLIEGKGIFVLADALCRISDDGMCLRIRIVGEGRDRERMEARLRGQGKLSVIFTGSQEGDALSESYRSARVLAVPSTTHPEGMGLVAAEGMAFGLPVVASDQAALREVVGDAGVIVRKGDAEGLASALMMLLRDQNCWSELSERARQRSNLFSMSNFKKGIAELLEEVAEGKKYGSPAN